MAGFFSWLLPHRSKVLPYLYLGTPPNVMPGSGSALRETRSAVDRLRDRDEEAGGPPLVDLSRRIRPEGGRRISHLLPGETLILTPSSWDAYLYGFARHAATKSKDSTKVGAVLVGPEGEVRLTAFNGPPKGVRDTPDRFERPRKYLFAAHAERNLVAFAAREGITTKGCTVYCTHACCSVCAQTMIQAGIKHLIHGDGEFVGMDQEVAAAREMFAEVGGTMRRFTCTAG